MLKITSRSTIPVVDLAEVKDRLRIDHSDDDLDIERLIDAATELFEERAMVVLRPTSYQMRLSAISGCISLPVFPFREVQSITYLDANGDVQTVGEDVFEIVETTEGAEVVFPGGWRPSSLSRDVPLPVTVNFEAGYDIAGLTESGLPLKSKIAVAIMSLVGHWYENREAAGDDTVEIPLSFKTIAEQERVFR